MAEDRLTYNQCIAKSMECLGLKKADEHLYLAAVLDEAVTQKTTSQAIFMAIIEGDKPERKRWKAFFTKQLDKRRNKTVYAARNTSAPNTPPPPPPPPPKEYTWNFESSAKTKTVNSIWPTKLKTPVVQYTPEVRAIIDLIVATCTKEVGWLGTVSVSDNVYTIDQIFLPKQIVSSVETDIDADAMAAIAEELFNADDDPGRLFYWGHSHVNMNVSPSKQDEDQVREYLDACPRFIRGIYNKKGEEKVDFYDREARLVFQNLEARTAFELPPERKETLLQLIKTNVVNETLTVHNYRLPGPHLHSMYRPPMNSGGYIWPEDIDEDAEFNAILKDPFGVRE